MLTSLFGDLGSLRNPVRRDAALGDEPDAGFAATTILESVATEVNERGQMVDRHQRDLVVSGSPAAAIRDHFASTRADLEVASRQITLLDPAGVWASAVVKALSDAGGQPVERLHLREQGTLRTLAMIERTTLVRRHDDALKVYHADVRAPGRDTAEIPVALMERSHLTTVIVGPMQPHAIDALLVSLSDATRLPTWRCPNLLFMLPPSAVWIANKIHAIGWPGRLHVHVIDEPMVSASSVWNALLGIWSHVKERPVWETATADYPIKVAELGGLPRPAPVAAAASAAASGAAPHAPGASSRPRPPLDPARVHHALIDMLPLEGLLGCAAVDATTGLVLARELREDHPVDMDVAAAASSQVLQAHRSASSSMGLGEHVEEVTSSSSARQQVLRVLTRHPEVFVLAVLDRQRTNLPLARYKLMELDKALV
jgi:predicted regulator of Ras-like GTPase activity (Roadblock/LC7/MglB family)